MHLPVSPVYTISPHSQAVLYTTHSCFHGSTASFGHTKGDLSVVSDLHTDRMPSCSRLSDRVESVQKKALKIICPSSSYSQALSLAKETTLSNRRELLCHKFMAEMTDNRDHPLSCLMSTAVQITNPYNLRPGSFRPFNKFTRTKRSENFFTFKYSSFRYPS